MEKTMHFSQHYLYSFFAMFVTLLSFILLSLQITFISILWGFNRFISHVNHKFTGQEPTEKF